MKVTTIGLRLAGGFLVLGILTGCQMWTPPPEPQRLATKVYIANESSNSVTVVDGSTYQVLGEIDTLKHAPHDLALTRDGKQLWATNLASGRVSVINTDSMETFASIYTGKRSHVVTLTNNNKHAWVANIDENTISIIDTKIHRILGTIPVPGGPMGIAFSRDGKLAYVSTKEKNVKVIDTMAHRVIKSIPVGPNPHFLVLGPDGRIWGTNTGRNDIFIIDSETNEVSNQIEVGPGPQQIAFGFKGTTGPLAYVTVSGINRVVVVNAYTPTPTVRGHIDLGTPKEKEDDPAPSMSPNGIWANAVGTRLYVGHTVSNDLRVIDTGTERTLAAIPVGKKPIRVVASR